MDRSCKGGRRTAALWILGIYSLVMLWLLLFHRRPTNLEYWEYVKSSYNLQPLRTLRQMISLLQNPRFARFAATNLAGNILLFVPLGLLPVLWQRQRAFRWYLLTVGLLILAVELLQLFSTLGTADVDDWLFNMAGACLGYGLWRLFGAAKQSE